LRFSSEYKYFRRKRDDKMKFKEPIFVIGVSRSGTSILSELITQHKDTAYFENYSSYLYKHPGLFRFIPLLKKYQKFRYKIDRPKRSEGWVWDRFFNQLEHLDESHATEEIKNYYYNAIEHQLRAFNATRFVVDNPRNCMRIRWLNRMFPNAFYIIISRDKKSVISSMYQQLKRKKEMRGDKFLDGPNNLRGYGHIKKMLGKNCSDLQTCINYYELYRNTLNKDLPIVSDRVKTINYEEFVLHSRDTIKKVFEFIHLQWYDELNKLIPENLQIHYNEKWKLLPDNEKKILLEYCENKNVEMN